MVRIGLFGGGIVDPRTPVQALLCFRFVACVNWKKIALFYGASEGGLPASRADGGRSLGRLAFAGYCSRPFPHP